MHQMCVDVGKNLKLFCNFVPVIRLLSIAPQMHEISLISTVRTDSACFRGVAARQHALATLKPFHFPADFHVIDICCFYDKVRTEYKVRYSIAYIDFAQLSKRRSLHLWGARALWSANMQPSRAQFFIGGVVGQRRPVRCHRLRREKCFCWQRPHLVGQR